MAFRRQLKKYLCCKSDCDDSATIIKRAKGHKFCGCEQSSQQRTKMKTTCDSDRTTLVENEEIVDAVEALGFDFIDEEIIDDLLIPFSHDLTNALHPQSDIIIQGVVDEKAIRFEVNLIIGRNDSSDIAFHFNPRMDQLYTARNSRFNGIWGPEEGNSQQKFPFHRGTCFHMQLFLTHSEFLVAVNGIHYCSYTFRTSLLNICSIQIVGGVQLSRVHLHTTPRYPSPLPPECTSSPYKFSLQSQGITKNSTEITPVYGLLQEKIKINSEIEISGRVKLLPFSFFINFQEGNEIWPHPEIPLHISVRFSQGGDHVILANAWLSTSWGKEEFTRTKCLFTPGYPFVLRITCNDDSFIAKVDNQLLLAFKHRVPYKNIDTIHIQGDVFIYNITVHL